jgi:hypothetical protein
MSKLLTLLLLAGFAASAAAAAPAPEPAKQAGTHIWVHPKMGQVKVDSRTHGIVVAKKQRQQEGTKAMGAAPAQR